MEIKRYADAIPPTFVEDHPHAVVRDPRVRRDAQDHRGPEAALAQPVQRAILARLAHREYRDLKAQPVLWGRRGPKGLKDQREIRAALRDPRVRKANRAQLVQRDLRDLPALRVPRESLVRREHRAKQVQLVLRGKRVPREKQGRRAKRRL